MLVKALIGITALSALLGWFLWGAIEDKAKAEAQLSVALSANEGLAKSRLEADQRHREELARRDAVIQQGENAVRVAQQNESAADTELAAARQRLSNFARSNPDACIHSIIPDALFDGVQPEGG